MNQQEAINQLREEALLCTQCSLRQSASQVVFGEGNPSANIMVIGEGPGQEEDRLGRPFVGPAGQLLDKILAAGGFERFQHTYIANIVKCRPPRNRIPTPLERATCSSYLHRQIKIVDPVFILLLGATALQGLIKPDGRITKDRGSWITWENRQVLPTYHPAALLRDVTLKRPVWEDIKALVSRYREEVDPGHVSQYC
jgi:DNA polymerase